MAFWLPKERKTEKKIFNLVIFWFVRGIGIAILKLFMCIVGWGKWKRRGCWELGLSLWEEGDKYTDWGWGQENPEVLDLNPYELML